MSEPHEHRLNNAQALTAEAASAWCWNPTAESEKALRDAVAEWRTALGLWRLAARGGARKPAVLTCGKCERPITEEESQWGWCPECAAKEAL